MRVHWTFVVLVALFLFWMHPVLLLMLFGSVFLHELGHCVVAQRYGIRVLDITLWPLGGMARMSHMPEKPAVEGWIAAAGPLVNLALVLLGLALMAVLPADGAGMFGILNAGQRSIGVLPSLVEINLILGIFNLVPAFPMDGGRLLRAFLAIKRPWLQATEMAVGVGRQLAAATILASFVACIASPITHRTFPWALPLIAGFVWFAGGKELWAVRMRELEKRRGTHQSIFDLFTNPRFGGSPGPGVPPDGYEEERDEPDAERRADTADTEAGGARRPQTWDVGQGRGEGFSTDDVEALERYRGRIRRRRPPAQ